MIREKLYWVDAVFRIESLIVYTNIRKDPVVKELHELLNHLVANPQAKETSVSYYRFLNLMITAAEQLNLRGNVFGRYMIYRFLMDENPYTLACEKERGMPDGTISAMALKDMVSLKFFIDMDIKNICDSIGYKENLTEYIPSDESNDLIYERIEEAYRYEDILEQLTKYYAKSGYGIEGCSKILRINRQDGLPLLEGVADIEKVSFSSISGNEYPKLVIRNNTRSFVSGGPSDNILLSGHRGTGKFSCIKALPSMFYDSRLRIVDMEKSQAEAIPALINRLSARGLFFIIYIEDIGIDYIQRNIRYLRPLLDSGFEHKPDNILIYASCNPDFLDSRLSEYFGITLNFSPHTNEEYMIAVRALAKKNNLNMPDDFLTEQAMKFAEEHKYVTGRTAKQFVKNIIWELSNH